MQKPVLSGEAILLNARVSDKESAIKLAGRLLVENGFVEEAYVDKMLERERVTSTYIGNHVAIPHGTEEAKRLVKAAGISIVQIPEGVDFGDGQVAKLVIGISGKGDEHLQILSSIALVCSDPKNVEKIVQSQSKEALLSFFEGVN
ncbi:MAG: PTS mannitol transporter subunit IIA [Thermoactinomycetaceae bacterium]|nr:PTS mannitol transporter subunit IIA [Thermoactinomycetaceae bacterium]